MFIIYKSFNTVDSRTWNALFWIIFLFAALNGLVKSFLQESEAREIYYYSIVHPIELILSKVLYNIIMLLVLGFLIYGCMGLFLHNPVRDYDLFLASIIMGSIGVSLCFTFVSAISMKSGTSATLMAVLSFPVILPVLLVLIKLTANSLRLIQESSVLKDFYILAGIDLLLLGLCLLLFPVIWRS